MSTDTYPHRPAATYAHSSTCACGARFTHPSGKPPPDWGRDCPAALREAMATVMRERDALAARVAELEAHVGSLHKATAAGRDAERAAVVAWLRGPAGFRMVPANMAYCDYYADAIARGEHLNPEDGR